MALKKTFPNAVVATKTLDETSSSVDTYFLRSLSDFTISIDTGESGIDVPSLIYAFEAAGGHAIVPGDEILLQDIVANRQFFAEVLTVSTNLITLDRMIDHNFQVASTLGQRVSSKMNVDGSSTPIIFSICACENPLNIRRYIITIIDNAAMDDGKFGSLTALTRGLVLRIVNSYQQTILNFKTNGQIKQFA